MREFIKNNAFSKLVKAIKQGDRDEMVNSMLHLKFNPKNKTHGKHITRETNRALVRVKNLHQHGVPKKVQEALAICKEKAGPLWDTTSDELLARRKEATMVAQAPVTQTETPTS